MTNIAADKIEFQVNVAELSRFMRDMQNFRDIMPEQIEDWYADESSCSFTIKNLGKLGMQITESDPQGSFKFESTDQSKVDFMLLFHFHSNEDKVNSGHFEIKTEMNPLVEMMAKRPLTNFVNILTKNLQQKLN